MTPTDDDMMPNFQQMADQVAKEKDPQKLRQLVWEINVILDVLERRVAEFEGKNPQTCN